MTPTQPLTGFHHLTAITANAPQNLAFYTQCLGLRLVKKTVNQDDVSAYHLFYADGAGSPGTDITFFDWNARPARRGTGSIVRTGFRLGSSDSLQWWARRLAELGVQAGTISELDGRPSLDFEDPEGQRLRLVVDESPGEGHPWRQSPVPSEHQVLGLGPMTLSVPDLTPTARVLTEVMAMREVRQYTARATDGSDASSLVHVFQMGEGGPSADLHVAVEPHLPPAHPGAGSVHHVAFRIPTFDEYDRWNAHLRAMRIPSSGPIDRFYFKSLYFREPNGILFELATDQPGFAVDEPADQLGERLSLPPFLESRRAQIEAGLRPL